MNEHVAVWPKLSLARELPFQLAGTRVRPSALEVETEGEVTTLEPRVMKVLVALQRAKGHPVSRDELIDLCWEGRIVTEGALNRCIAQLRKALAANACIRLDTIATVGYRLQTERRSDPAVEPMAERPADVAASATDASTVPNKGAALRPSWQAAAVAVAGLAAVTVGAYAYLNRPVTWTTAAYRPLTSDAGMETHPAISPNGQQLVYSQRADSRVGRDLYIRGVEQGTPVRITTDPADDHSAAWSPGGDRLAFVRTRPGGGVCDLIVAPVPLGPERVAARCESSTYTRVGWLDANTLVIGDRPGNSDLWRIRAVDLTSGGVRDLTHPPVESLGDSDPSVSPDGRLVAFRRSRLHGADDLYVKDLRTGRERALTTDGWKAAGYIWSGDSRHIFYASNRGGEFALWTVDTARKDPPRRIGLGVGQVTFSRMSIDRRNRLVVEVPRLRTNLARLTPGGGLEPVTDATGGDWDPAVAADGAVAYASNRTGGSELWITRPDGISVQLTRIGGSYVHSPAWSADGRSIAFVGVKGRRAEVYTVARDGSQLRAITNDGLDKLDPVWSPDGRIRYIERTAGGARVMEIPAAPGANPRPLGHGGLRDLRAGADGRLFGIRADGAQVIALDGGPAPDVRIAGSDRWVVGPEGIYVLRARRETAPAVWLHPWTGAPRRLADVETGTGRLGVSPGGAVVVSRNLDEQVDLAMIELASNR
jgi:Tol biopolymer transport system component/DNA-binding winged helix-turn-helix (wHTH) protein